jgi:uncharacterized protein (TIGR03067 family)
MPRRLVLASALAAVAAAGLFASARPGRQPPPPAPAQPAATPPTPRPSDALDGTWELVSVIEDGQVIPIEHIKETAIKDARIVVSGQLASVLRPDGKVRTYAFVTNPAASPRTLDVAGDMRVGGRGIYLRDGDTLMVCTRGSDTESRPTQFASLPGTDTFLMTFQRVKGPATTPPATTPAPPAVPARPTDDQVRTTLIGTWGHQTDDQVVKVTFNPDNTYSILTTYKRGFKKVFDREDRTSGTWRLKDGELMLTATASTLGGVVGQVSSYRITSINDAEVLYVDNQTGQRRIEWKLR